MNKNITKQELIGLSIEVIDSKNKSNIGIKGKIIDETKSTIIIKQNKEKKRIFKKNITINVKINNKNIKINGEKLFGKPKERIKK